MVLGNVKFINPSDVDTQKSEVERLLTALYSSIEGTYPMNRAYGLSQEALDYPLPIAQTMLAEEIYNKTEIYVPQCNIESVDFQYDEENDAIIPLISFEIEDEILDDEDYESEDDEDYECD